MPFKSYVRIFWCAMSTSMLLFCGTAQAQTWPTKPIRLIVPYPPGGGTDIVARLLASGLTEKLGQTVIVENKSGASTIIGTSFVSKAEPDGYTVGLVTDSFVINPKFMKELPYDSLKDFAPISQLVRLPFVLLSAPKLGVNSVGELVAKAKARPGTINYASIGNGTPHYLAMEWFKHVAGVELIHVPYTGVAPALNGLVGQQVDVMFTGLSTGMPYVNDGRLKALAVASAQRAKTAPNVPTVAESGYAGFEFVPWYGLVAPRGTPTKIVDQLSLSVKEVMANPAIQARLDTLGVEPTTSSPEQFGKFLTEMSRQYAEIIDKTGAKAE